MKIKNILMLNELEHALRYWEDVNLFNETFFRIFIDSGVIKAIPQYSAPLIGSEVNRLGHLKRAIKNYKGLRKMIESNIDFEPELFIPRIPKESRDKFTSTVDFIQSFIVFNAAFFPYVLAKWLKYKRVFMLDKISLLPTVDVNENNYLDKLPYGSFLFKFNQPLTYSFSENRELRYKIMIVYSDGEFITVFMIRDDMEELLLSESNRKFITENLAKHKIPRNVLKKAEELSLFDSQHTFGGFRCEIKSGSKVAMVQYGKNNEKIVGLNRNVFSSNPTLAFKINDEIQSEAPLDVDGGIIGEIMRYEANVINILNGFAKFMSELPSKESELLFKENKIEGLPKFDQCDWMEIPITSVDYIDQHVVDGKKTITTYKGGEKSAHWRRGHFRRYRDENNKIISEVWIEEVHVRKDKLEMENLKGNATLLKEHENNAPKFAPSTNTEQ